MDPSELSELDKQMKELGILEKEVLGTISGLPFPSSFLNPSDGHLKLKILKSRIKNHLVPL